MKSYLKSVPLWFTSTITLTILVISVFWSSGFNLPAYGDEWPLIASFDRGVPLNIQGATRSLLEIPIRISYALSPDSFAGFNWYQAVMILARGILIYVLFRLLRPKSPSLALVIGALTILYPGDVAAYILSNVHYMTAIALYLLALIMLVKYWQRPHMGWLLIMALAQIFCLGMYEGSLPLIFVSPFVLIYLQHGLTRRVLRVAAYWYLVPLLFVVRVVILTSGGQGLEYQTFMINPDNSLPSLIGGAAEVFIREFGRIWAWAELAMPQGFSDVRTWLVLAVTLTFGIALWLHARSDQEEAPVRSDLLVVLAGLIVLALGYAPFVITIYRDGFFRTLLFGLPGAAVALAVAFRIAVRAPFLIRLLLAVLFLCWALLLLSQTDRLSALLLAIVTVGFLLPQNKRYWLIGASVVGYALAFNIGIRAAQPFADLPARQHQFVATMVQQVPAIKSQTLVLLLGAPDTKEQFAFVRNRYDIFQGLLQFVYKQYDFEAQICDPNGVVWAEYNTKCELQPNEVVISLPVENRTLHVSYDRVLAFIYDQNGDAVLLDHIPTEWMTQPGAEAYNPDTRIDHTAPLPYRLQTVWTQ